MDNLKPGNRNPMAETASEAGVGPHRMNLIILIVFALSLASLVAIILGSSKMYRDYFPVVQAMAEFEVDLAIGHLWFEEILGGDRAEKIEVVQEKWDDAALLINAVLEGGDTRFGRVTPLNNPDEIRQLEDIIGQLKEFRMVADQRFAAAASSAAGTDIDQAFDLVFGSLLGKAQDLSSDVNTSLNFEATKLKSLQWGLLGGNFLLALVLWMTLTRYKRQQSKSKRLLETSELRYRLMFDTAAEGILVVDIATKKFLYANPAICQLLGYGADDFTSLGPEDIHPPEAMERVSDQFSGLGDKGFAHTPDINCIHRDGTVLTVDINANLIEIGGRQLAMGLFTDKTHEKQAQEEKEKLEDKLQQAQKMEAVGNLAGGIAHDFNNLLQAILGYTELLMESENCGDGAAIDLDKIHKAGTRAADLTNQLLTFSRRQVISPSDLDLNLVIPDLLKIMTRLIGENIQLSFLPGSSLGSVCMDKGQLEQVMMNLCLNGRDAMGSGGKLTIETENVLVDEDFCQNHPWALPGRHVLLSITDTGDGMSPEIMNQIFEPFFTTKEVGKGTGLGLATVYGIVKQNNGMIHAYSEIDKGTTFKVYFPLVERPASQVGDKISGTIPGGTETILLAEDDIGVRSLAQRLLTEAGYSVLAAQNGKEALELFRNHQDAIELAVLDVVMPEMGGREVQEAIHALQPGVKVMFASGYSQNAIHTDFVLDKGKVLLSKPFAREDLLRKVREVLDAE